MTTILSWNTGKKKTDLIRRVIDELVVEHSLDILVLQECLGKYINTILDGRYDEVPYLGGGIDRRVRIFLKKTKFKYYSIKPEFNNKLIFVHLENIDTKSQFNIAGVHLYSKWGNTERQQLWKNLPFIQKIDFLETTASSNTNTIVIGDFNYNPYETHFSDPNVFNAIDNRYLISNFESNPVGSRNHTYWYNPMWNLLGDYDYKRRMRKKATGSYFLYAESETPYWHLLDSVLLRPSIMDLMDYENTEVITETKSIEFIKPLITRTDESYILDDLSDHLPVKFTINI